MYWEKAMETMVRAEAAAPELQKAIRARLSEGRPSCADIRDIAAGMGLPRLKRSSACEALKIGIQPGQLGAFSFNPTRSTIRSVPGNGPGSGQ